MFEQPGSRISSRFPSSIQKHILQSTKTKKIHMVKFRTQKLLNCSFTYAAAKLWNDLPISLRVCENYDAFKSKLKSHLFKHSFEEFL